MKTQLKTLVGSEGRYLKTQAGGGANRLVFSLWLGATVVMLALDLRVLLRARGFCR